MALAFFRVCKLSRGLWTVNCLPCQFAPVPTHPSRGKLCLGTGLERRGDSVYRRSFLLFPIKILAQKKKRACLSCRLSQRQIPGLNSEASSPLPHISAFPVTNNLLLWVTGPLMTPGGEWAEGSTAMWKYCAGAIQTQREEACQEVDAAVWPFAFLVIEEKPSFSFSQTQLVPKLML